MPTIFALGPQGTFSARLAEKLLATHVSGTSNYLSVNGDALTCEFTRTIPEIFHKVESDPDSFGAVPIENNSAGPVGQTMDSLENSDVRVIGEIREKIRFALLAFGNMEGIRNLYIHPMAFNQCMNYISDTLKNARVVNSDSNMDSYNRFMGDFNEFSAAIVPEPWTEDNEVDKRCKIFKGVQDFEHNETRFLVISKNNSEKLDFTKQKSSIFIDTDADRPSLLYDILTVFHEKNINMSMLHSRPSRKYPGSYTFFIDFLNQTPSDTKVNEDSVLDCISGLEKLRLPFRILGSYDVITL